MTIPVFHSHGLIFLSFFIYAFVLGTLFPRIGDLQQQMGLGEGALGLSIIGLPLGLQLSLIMADRVLRRVSMRIIMIVGTATMSVFYTLAALVANVPIFFACVFMVGLAVGFMEVAVNLETDRIENVIKRRIMNRAHAFWSLGFFATGLMGALMAQMQISVAVHFASFGAIALVATLFCFWGYKQAPERSPNAATSQVLFVRPTKAILVLVLLSLPALLAEGSSIDWSVIFMRDTFATPPFINGMALALVALSQFATRYHADHIVDRYGPQRVSLVCLWILFVGVWLVVLSPDWRIALIGFTSMGAGSSVIFPLAVSAAAQFVDRPAAVNVAALAQISFGLFLLAPPLLGFVAEHIGIRYAFAICLPLVIISFFSIHGLSTKKQP